MGTELFDRVAERLEQLTSLDRIEARGTLRIALKKSGLDASQLSPAQVCVVLAKVMPRELEVRSIENAAAICATVAGEIESSTPGTQAPDARDSYEVFKRLGKSSG